MAPNGHAEASSRMFALITAIAALSFWGSDQKGRRLTLLGLRSKMRQTPAAPPTQTGFWWCGHASTIISKPP
jgi:hypothetical protein